MSGSIINASGGTRAATFLVAVTVLVGGVASFALVRGTAPGAPMIVAEAGATAIGMATGFALTLVYLWRRFAAGPPIASVLRVGAAVASATLVGRVAPSGGKILGLATLGAVGAVYLVTLLVLREFGPEDRAKFRKILRR